MNKPTPTSERDEATESPQPPPEPESFSPFRICVGIFAGLGLVGGAIGGFVEFFRGGFPVLLIPVFTIGGFIGGTIVGAAIGAVVTLIITLRARAQRRTGPASSTDQRT